VPERLIKFLKTGFAKSSIHKRNKSLLRNSINHKNTIPHKAGFLLSLIVILSLMIPPCLSAPDRVNADAGIMRWDTISTPGSVFGRFDILSPGDIIDVAQGSLGRVVAIVRVPETTPSGAQNQLFYSNNWGMEWRDAAFHTLGEDNWGSNEIFFVAIAPDNPNVWAIVAGFSGDTPPNRPRHVFYTDDAGVSWLDTELQLQTAGETIRSIDISPTYGNALRDMAITTVTGTGAGRFYIATSKSYSQWFNQSAIPSVLPVPNNTADYFDIKFSPTYATDFSFALVYATSTTTYFNVGFRDVAQNTTVSYAFNEPGIEVKNSASANNASPGFAEINATCLQLPADFTGQTASLRRAYISLDADGHKAAGLSEDGVFRIDDAHVYVLMDTTKVLDKSIYGITYYGTYAQGKLLLGERNGYPCTATVPTWFTDSPTTCPIPCWYPALKPPTGAAAQGTCGVNGTKNGIGAARVLWTDDGGLAFAGTGSRAETIGATWYATLLLTPVANDESAFAISRNNGETWNELGLIDTTIDWLNDVAPTVDCSTIYLASANRNGGTTGCASFDSVWRTTLNNNISNPLPISQPPNYYWERILTRTTSTSCTVVQTDAPLLRLPPGCTDKPDGEVVAWAAQGSPAQMWSPDYGDFWSEITSRDPIQDFAFESSSILYNLTPDGLVHRLTFSGTAWDTTAKSYDSRVVAAHTIAVLAKDKVLVGAAQGGTCAASFSPTRGEQWIEIARGSHLNGNIHVAFDYDFANNKFVYLADDKLNAAGLKDTNLTGTIYREEAPAYLRLEDTDMMSEGNAGHAAVKWPPTAPNGLPIFDPPHREGQFGVVAARTGDQPAVYTAHNTIRTTLGFINSAVCRTIKPWQAMPKYGVPWDCLDIYNPRTQNEVHFTLEPSSLKACGCCTLDTYTTLFAIDDVSGGISGDTGYDPETNQGMLWAYIDCIAKKGPASISPLDGGFIGSDPVTGRNQQVDMSWEQLCVAVKYELQLFKDRNLTMKVNPAITSPGGRVVITAVTGSITVNLDNQNVTSPTVWISPGALPEAGASYWWRVRVIQSSTGQIATSPWSKEISFSIKPGFIVKTPVQGVDLLSPKNSCAGCAIQPTAFSWTPYKEATKYEFVLAKDPSFMQVVKKAITTSTAYEYKDALEYSKSYYWRVRGSEINGTSNVSDWSGTFTFQTVAPPPPEPPKLTKQQQFQKDNPNYLWLVIAIVFAVIIVILVFIRQSRRSRWD
jgi:hypothetical protein